MRAVPAPTTTQSASSRSSRKTRWSGLVVDRRRQAGLAGRGAVDGGDHVDAQPRRLAGRRTPRAGHLQVRAGSSWRPLRVDNGPPHHPVLDAVRVVRIVHHRPARRRAGGSPAAPGRPGCRPAARPRARRPGPRAPRRRARAARPRRPRRSGTARSSTYPGAGVVAPRAAVGHDEVRRTRRPRRHGRPAGAARCGCPARPRPRRPDRPPPARRRLPGPRPAPRAPGPPGRRTRAAARARPGRARPSLEASDRPQRRTPSRDRPHHVDRLPGLGAPGGPGRSGLPRARTPTSRPACPSGAR